MSANKSPESAAPDPSNEHDDLHELKGSGSGAASALERMKAESALRHKRQHGPRTSGPGHGEDRSPER